MTLREAMDLLGLRAEEVAERLNVSVQTIRQARMKPDASGYRNPPDGWEEVLASLAEHRLAEIEKFLSELR